MTTATKPKPSARHKLAEALTEIMADYDTLPAQERHAVDVAIVQCLDANARDWAMGMRALIERLSK